VPPKCRSRAARNASQNRRSGAPLVASVSRRSGAPFHAQSVERDGRLGMRKERRSRTVEMVMSSCCCELSGDLGCCGGAEVATEAVC
jgi:hypothetical protein